MKARIGITVVEALQLDDKSVRANYADGIEWEYTRSKSGQLNQRIVIVTGSREAIEALQKDCYGWSDQGGEWDHRLAQACKRAAKSLRKTLDKEAK